ncbi:MAG TPA: histidine kinase [Microbacterium sp.]|nr:histidine kinase [Microbacterium sp.]
MGRPPHAARNTSSAALRGVGLYAAAILSGLVLLGVVWGTHLQQIPDAVDQDTVGLTGALMITDALLGIAAIGILPLRRRHPLAVAIVGSAVLVLSASATSAAVVAAVHLAIVAGRRELVLTGAIWTAALFGNGILIGPAIGIGVNATETVGILILALLMYVALVAVGRYRRARAETLQLLQERAERAERERERDVRAAREAERLRIAREMHDVLAHRMSIVSMHAGALAYRLDLPREKVSEAAQVIQESTALALSELRGLLGVLRDDASTDPVGPQPVLDHLPILLADARAAGLAVRVEFSGIEVADGRPFIRGLDETVSRTAYRVVQEALTNVRKHAPGELVRLRIAREDGRLVIVGRNRMPERAEAAVVPSGLGLIGLAERAHLAGGTLTSHRADGDFVLRGTLPWG